LAKVIEKCEAGGFLDTDAAGANALVREGLGGDPGRALVFLPNPHFDREAQLLAKAPFLEAGHHQNRTPGSRKHQGHQALAQAPANPREVIQRRARSEEQRVIFRTSYTARSRQRWRLCHEPLRLLQVPLEFIRRNGPNPATQWFERG
jgi:hypothetical protein